MKTITVTQIDLQKAVEKDSTIAKNFFNMDFLKVMTFSFDAGQELSDHSSKREAILHVLEGTGTFATEAEQVNLKPGTWIHIPSTLTHRVNATTTLHFLLYLI